MPPAARDLHLATATPDDTRALGAAIAAALRPGDVLSLTGELGAGKTCFVQGAAQGLGVTERVTSPSFVLRREYRGRHPVVHLDVYRLETLREVEDLGYEDVLAASHVTFIEWGDAMSPLLPADYLEVELSLEDLPPGSAASGAQGDVPLQEPRRIVVRPHGADWARRLTDLAADLSPWTRHEEES
ncbi:MAG: tRNA (adenosine(37)-N6)-threonylcarbamoyltransferase complex ATPase subunit type 1 TsaE [Egibacteraceae bacterium]